MCNLCTKTAKSSIKYFGNAISQVKCSRSAHTHVKHTYAETQSNMLREIKVILKVAPNKFAMP